MKIKEIIIHVSDSPEGRADTVDDIRRWHLEKGWSDIGYHYVLGINGELWKGRDLDRDGDILDEIGAHAYGYNRGSVGICIVGGATDEEEYADREPKDTRTQEQHIMLRKLVFDLLKLHVAKNAVVIGHNQVSDKACPCFDVYEWGKLVGIPEKHLHEGKYTR